METNTPFHCIHGVLEGCCNVCHVSPYECPECARFREKIDREKMAKVMYDHYMHTPKIGYFGTFADALIKYLTE